MNIIQKIKNIFTRKQSQDYGRDLSMQNVKMELEMMKSEYQKYDREEKNLQNELNNIPEDQILRFRQIQQRMKAVKNQKQAIKQKIKELKRIL